MRGKVISPPHHNLSNGITPAYAGKSRNAGVVVAFVGDHPRLCGEKDFSTSNSTGVPRITPAYAGKRISRIAFIILIWDHPRLCGEKCRLCSLHRSFKGSPPPMRGKAKGRKRNVQINRITPAYAGKSSVSVSPISRLGDHPRLCGEKTKKIPKQRYFFHQPASFSFSLQYT